MAISRDTTGGPSNVTATSLTSTHVCSGNDRLLLVHICILGADNITSVKYDGVDMTRLIFMQMNGGSQYSYIYGLLSPNTGSHNIVTTVSVATFMACSSASYKGVLQSGLPDASNQVETAAQTSTTLSVTTVLNGCWAFLGFSNGTTPTSTTGAGNSSAGTNATLISNQLAGFEDIYDTQWYGAITPAGSFGMTITSPNSANRLLMVSFAPVPNSGNFFLFF